MWRKHGKTVRTGDSSDGDASVEAFVSGFCAAPPPPSVRRIGDSGSGSRHGLPAAILGLGGEASGKSMSGDGGLDASLVMHARALCGPGPHLSVREIDPIILDQTAQEAFEALEDTRVKLKRLPEIKAVHRRLGAGGFGEVFHCTMKDSHLEVAVKVPHKGSDVSQKREVEMLSKLKHGNLVQFHCLLCGPLDALVHELCAGGSLASLLHGNNNDGLANLGVRPRIRASMDIVSAVDYLHSRRILHRDIKVSNAFLTAPACMPVVDLPPLKLGDLGLARELGDHMTQCTGTWRYMAPEVLCSNLYAEPADIYSCGLLLYEVTSGKIPFGDMKINSAQVVAAVALGRRPNPNDVRGPSHLVAALANALEACWGDDPSGRPSASCLAGLLEPLASGAVDRNAQ